MQKIRPVAAVLGLVAGMASMPAFAGQPANEAARCLKQYKAFVQTESTLVPAWKQPVPPAGQQPEKPAGMTEPQYRALLNIDWNVNQDARHCRTNSAEATDALKRDLAGLKSVLEQGGASIHTPTTGLSPT